jgi:D-lyxose ketol-isomerase
MCSKESRRHHDLLRTRENAAMRRSHINRFMRDATSLLSDHRFHLPPWAHWSPDEWAAHPQTAAYCRSHQIGWDVTDFGAGRFDEKGLLLFCVRNGIQGQANEAPYAEKILVVRENQETPWHYHKVKMEDIIVRGGGNLIVECFQIDAEGQRLAQPFDVLTDGMRRTVKPGEPIRLKAGESITLPRGLVHRFYGEAGTGTVLAGEVSQVNDDLTDNTFIDPVGRFAQIEEDEPPLHPLWSELPVSEEAPGR